MKRYNRPLMNTEWMNRPAGSTIEDNVPVFYAENVGRLLWGLVNGKTQTHLPWGHRPGDPSTAIWQHDLYKSDLTPYQAKEINLVKSYTDRAKAKIKAAKGLAVLMQ